MFNPLSEKCVSNFWGIWGSLYTIYIQNWILKFITDRNKIFNWFINISMTENYPNIDSSKRRISITDSTSVTFEQTQSSKSEVAYVGLTYVWKLPIVVFHTDECWITVNPSSPKGVATNPQKVFATVLKNAQAKDKIAPGTFCSSFLLF